MAENIGEREVVWVASSLEDLRALPEEVSDEIGYVLWLVQVGDTHSSIKPLTGIGAGAFEIRADFDTNTYRAVYAVKIADEIFVLHVLQKKSKRGIATPKRDLDLIKRRYKQTLAKVQAKKE